MLLLLKWHQMIMSAPRLCLFMCLWSVTVNCQYIADLRNMNEIFAVRLAK